MRNNPDGSVEAVFEGEEEDVRQMVQWCYRGPSLARVDHVDVEWQPYSGEFGDFEVERGWFW